MIGTANLFFHMQTEHALSQFYLQKPFTKKNNVQRYLFARVGIISLKETKQIKKTYFSQEK